MNEKDIVKVPEAEIQANPIQEIPSQLEGMAKIAAATTVAQTLSYSTERKFLDNISASGSLCHLKVQGSVNHSITGYKWLRIDQVGNSSSITKKNCFEAMQTILHSCQIPNTQLAFLVIVEKGLYKMYLGMKGITKMNSVQNFISTNWRGIITKKCDEGDENLSKFISNDEYIKCYGITGVPTLNAQEKYAKGIEQIVGGLRDYEDAAYLVMATPVSAARIDGILSTCRELQSQTESFKSFSLTENIQQGKSRSLSKTTTHTITKTISQQVNANDGKKALGIVIGVTGLAVATAMIYPPALAMVPTALANAGKVSNQLVASVPRLKSALSALQMGSNVHRQFVAKGLIPKPTPPKKDKSIQDSTSESETYGYSESYSKSISQTITNSHVEAVLEHLKKHTSRFEEGKATGMWEVGCFLLSSLDDGGAGAIQVKSVLSGTESIYEPIRVHDVSSLLEDTNSGSIPGFVQCPMISANYLSDNENGYDDEPFRHPFGEEFSNLTTMLTTKELSCFINFPMNSLPGINVVDSWPDFSLTPQSFKEGTKKLELGRLLYNRKETKVRLSVPLDTFCRHALVAGVNGSGKTNSVLNIMEGFLNGGKPIMVIEPAKTEYVDWAISYNALVDEYNKSVGIDNQKKKIKIFIPGCERYAKGNITPDILRINPFEVIRLNEKFDFKVLSHIDRLKSVLAGAFPTQDILPTVLERLLYDLYTDTGWIEESYESVNEGVSERHFPTLKDVNLKRISKLMDDLGYGEENTMNISAAIRTRFNSMKYGWKNTLLNNEFITGTTWEELLDTPCVINLSYAGDDSDKAFVMSLLLQFLYEYRMAESEKDDYSYNENKCNHLVVIEEAHRVMTKCADPNLPQNRSNQMFSSILSEVRAYGQGVMVVDQVPSRLIEDAVKNTNIKIVHKIVAADDTKLISEAMGLTNEQQGIIPKLSVGQAILGGLNSADVGSPYSSDIFLAQMNHKKVITKLG